MEPSLIASMAYSTWKRRPSGEKVFTPRSYSLRVRYIFGVDLYVSLVDCRRYVLIWNQDIWIIVLRILASMCIVTLGREYGHVTENCRDKAARCERSSILFIISSGLSI